MNHFGWQAPLIEHHDALARPPDGFNGAQ
jgi:hypothetical protein